MSSFAQIDCDITAMALSCWETFLSPEQESALIEALKRGEASDDAAFSRDHEGGADCYEE